MLISVVNRSTKVSDVELQAAVRAVNRQLEEDFFPHWQFGARLRVDSAGRVPTQPEHRIALPVLPGRRGDAVIYIVDKATMSGAEGYHDGNNEDVPFGFVFLDACGDGADCWTVALSHEAIELVGDPLNNLMVQGPHPGNRSHFVFHEFELCDAVSGEYYEIDGIKVQNFLLPGWFSRKEVEGGRNDFMGRVEPGASLRRFTVAPGGYLMFWDGERPEHSRWTPFFDTGDGMAGRDPAATLAKATRSTNPAAGAPAHGDTEVPAKLKAKMQNKLSRLGRRCHPG